MIENNGLDSKLALILRNWQKMEDASVRNSTEVIKSTSNPLIQIVMEIIRQDSVMHRRVQQFILEILDKENFTITPDELEEFWSLVIDHEDLEKKVIAMAEESRENTTLPVVRYLLDYLLNDEKKHDKLLYDINLLKDNLYPAE